MPVLNERDYLERAVRTVLAQQIDTATEIVLALGPSSDGTTEIAQRLAAEDPRIVLVDNPRADIPVGLNLAIRASKYATIIRVDAHSELDPEYTIHALETLDRTGAANVGGIMRADGRNPFQRAVASAYNSPLGLGGASYHGGAEEGPAESAYLGVMRRDAIENVGLFDESIRRGEDWELNLRLRKAGYTVWFDPRLSVVYWPRESWARLARQFFATGTWRGELVRRYGRRNSIRFFAPPALVITAVIALIAALIPALGWLRLLPVLPLALYAIVVLGSAVVTKGGLREKLWTLVVLPTMHLAWGAGFLSGAARGARDNVDTSRLSGRHTPLP